MSVVGDSWQYLKRANTPPQSVVADLYRTAFGKITLVLGLGELTEGIFDLPLGLITALINYLDSYSAYLRSLT